MSIIAKGAVPVWLPLVCQSPCRRVKQVGSPVCVPWAYFSRRINLAVRVRLCGLGSVGSLGWDCLRVYRVSVCCLPAYSVRRYSLRSLDVKGGNPDDRGLDMPDAGRRKGGMAFGRRCLTAAQAASMGNGARTVRSQRLHVWSTDARSGGKSSPKRFAFPFPSTE